MTATTKNATVIPSIYVADLAAYNEGQLVGRWIELGEGITTEGLHEEISQMLLERGNEEWAIHDYENLPSSLGEYPDLEEVIQIAEAVREHGYKLVDGYINYFGINELSHFSDRYRGTYSSLIDYAYELVDECYNLEKLMGTLVNYFDYEKFARDLELSGDIVAIKTCWNEVGIFDSSF